MLMTAASYNENVDKHRKEEICRLLISAAADVNAVREVILHICSHTRLLSMRVEWLDGSDECSQFW